MDRGVGGGRMTIRITYINYDSKKGVVEVHIELPAIGPITNISTAKYLQKLVLDIFPEEIKQEIKNASREVVVR
jgi:hypothetical protein